MEGWRGNSLAFRYFGEYNYLMRRFLTALVLGAVTASCVLTNPPPTLPSITNGYGWHYGSHVHWQGDVEFTYDERQAIALACLHWAAFTNGGMWCTVDFQRDFRTDPFRGDADEYAIIRATSEDVPRDLVGGRLLGYAASHWNPITGNRHSALFLIADNLDSIEAGSHRQWLHVAKHEMAHSFGFEHIDEHHYRPNVMHSGYDHNRDTEKNMGGYFGEDDKAQCIRLGLCKF